MLIVLIIVHEKQNVKKQEPIINNNTKLINNINMRFHLLYFGFDG